MFRQVFQFLKESHNFLCLSTLIVVNVVTGTDVILFDVAGRICEQSRESAEERGLEKETDELAIEADSVKEFGDAVVRVLRVATELVQQCDVSTQDERLREPVTSQTNEDPLYWKL